MKEAEKEMMNPLSPVKMVRESYSRYLQKNFTEVQVQFRDEEPAWIPYDTLLAIKENEVEFQRRVKNGR
ncbi:hypothetical protein PRTG_00061 [Prochlorococcus phage P-SSM5]|jgi:hypothetical protein|uniref:Uncharacterized protein n=1 Tax=Prochlorococcus phage P-SSM5 TaxID=536454 RepID=R9S843_9CAUD|nr:hypothetical protein PRTG_00061 [Prochlorococcus phage P-SSM5]